MGQITERPRGDGTTAYLARVRRKKGGKTIFNMTETFSREADAERWIKKIEKDLAKGLLQHSNDRATLAEVIRMYLKEAGPEFGKTKRQCLEYIATLKIGEMRCFDITSGHLLDLIRELSDGRDPQTVGNYLSHLAAVFAVAEVAYKAGLSMTEFNKARDTARHLKLIRKSGKRTRRPTVEEMNRLMAYFAESATRTHCMPIYKILAFAIASCRRLSEITRLKWDDLDVPASTVIVRDMKHPGEKEGNDVVVDLPPEAMSIILSMPRISEFIFPYNPDTISTRFTRACEFLGIDDLHFHDLRHEGVSRLFEMGWTAQLVQKVSGHRSWQTLQRYTHVKKKGDKWAGWSWWAVVVQPEPAERVAAAKLNLLKKAAAAAAPKARRACRKGAVRIAA